MSSDTRFVSAATIRKNIDIHASTLRSWAVQGLVEHITLHSGKRLYDREHVMQLVGIQTLPKPKRRILYARVSSSHQRHDLERQIERLQQEFPGHELIKDLGSGLNFNRKGFKTLLDAIYNNSVEEVVVTYRDRLCRFGFELLEWIFRKHAVKLVVLDTLSDQISANNGFNELAEDLLAVTNFFVARNNGIRAGKARKARLKATKNTKAITQTPIVGIRDIIWKPNAQQKQLLKTWMGAHRYFYNQAVHFYYTHDMKCTLKELRSALLSGDALHQHEPWLNTIPFDIKDEGLRDFMKALSTNRNTKTSFHMRFKCKKDHKDGFVLHTKHWKHHKGSYAFLHDIQASEDLPSELPSDTRVVYQDGQRFVLKLSVRATENQSRCTSLPSDSKRDMLLHLTQVFEPL